MLSPCTVGAGGGDATCTWEAYLTKGKCPWRYLVPRLRRAGVSAADFVLASGDGDVGVHIVRLPHDPGAGLSGRGGVVRVWLTDGRVYVERADGGRLAGWAPPAVGDVVRAVYDAGSRRFSVSVRGRRFDVCTVPPAMGDHLHFAVSVTDANSVRVASVDAGVCAGPCDVTCHKYILLT